MTHDRNYLRMMHDCELTRYASDNNTTDLELVLLERLSTLLDLEDHLEDMKKEVKELEQRVDIWKNETFALQAQLEAK
jgi:predicted phage-related endonuclease